MAYEELVGVQTRSDTGDMLMRWSDDLLPSNFHRVKSPGAADHRGARYSIAFFAQANHEVMIEGPGGKYPRSARKIICSKGSARTSGGSLPSGYGTDHATLVAQARQ
jgi:hypothetical protein